MINDANVRQKIYAVLSKYLQNGTTLIWEKQGQPRPEKPFATMNLLTGPISVAHDEEIIDDDGATAISGLRELTLSVNFFGANAQVALAGLITKMGFPTARELFMQENLVFIDAKGPRDLSALMENKFETRAQADFRFRITDYDVDTETTYIETVVLENGIDNSSEEIN